MAQARLKPDLVSLKAANAAAHYRQMRATTVRLAAPLSVEDQQCQSMLLTSPTKWHLAHTTWFFETFVLIPHAEGYQPFDPHYDYLFNSYYESLGERYPRPARGLMTRPSLDAVHNYRQHVDDAVDALLARAESETVLKLVELGCHHEQQHQELILTDIKHLLSLNPLAPAYTRGTAPAANEAPIERQWVDFTAGVREIGYDGTGFCFDNEQPRHKVWADGFRLATRPVTNREWLAFIADRGYDTATLWLSDGWQTVQTEHWQTPLYWRHADDAWLEFTLLGLRPLDPDAPVSHVSFYEAEAFARWAGKRLPTEAEWEIAAADAPVEGNLLESSMLHPERAVAETGGLAQMFGDIWEWTQSPYTPYPGFRTTDGALGEYNGKFMANQMVLRGGSCATPQTHIRAEYRNFFPPSARWQFSGLRLAEDAR
jgi:ergothioneine biosynthesis protein EgtB